MNNTQLAISYLLIFILALTASGCSGGEHALRQMGKGDNLAVDGSTEGYTADPLEISGARVLLGHDGTQLYVHVRTSARGWIAVAFNVVGGGMDGANMVIGFVDSAGEWTARDDLGQGHTHAPVSNRITAFHGEHREGHTVFEFSYPMDFSGGFRVSRLTPGQTYSLIIAYHSQSMDPSTQHSGMGTSDFVVE